MNFKANYEIVELNSGSNIIPSSGGTALHQVYCIATGSAEIIAEGGGSSIFNLSANDKIDVLTRSVKVNSGTFIGFRVKG